MWHRIVPFLFIFPFFSIVFIWRTCPLLAETPLDKHPVEDEIQPNRIPDDNEKIQAIPPFVGEKMTLGILAEFNLFYIDISDESDRNSGDLYDFYLGSLEIDLEIFFNQWLKGDVAMELEDVGKKDETDTPLTSKAFITIQHPEFPLYFILGKRTQPFGVFNDRMISGTIIEELYEIEETGATFGVASDRYPVGLSFTVYEGQDIIANLENFGTHEFSDGRRKEHGIDSYIASFTFSGLDDALEMALFYNSEPGDGNRNESLGGAFSVSFWDLIVDAEYVAATEREFGENGEQNLENAWLIALAFQPAGFLELATRVEFFDDDNDNEQDEVIIRRYLAGLNYGLTEHIALSLEYRYSQYERQSGSRAADHQNEIQLQFAMEY